jgi:hypothetical protein
MGFANIDDKKLYTIFVLLVKSVERGNLPAKWRSSITPKDQDHGLLSTK